MQNFEIEPMKSTRTMQSQRSSYAIEYERTERRLKGTRLSVVSFHTEEESAFGGTPSNPSSPPLAGCIFNLANTIMGSALTGLPYVVKASGVIPYVVFLSISAYVGYTSITFLVLACAYLPAGKKDFQLLGETAFGAAGLKLTAISTVLSCFGALISYIVLIGIQIPLICTILGLNISAEKMQLLLSLGLILPLCLLKDISLLSPTSFLAIVVFLTLACTGVGSFLFQDEFYSSDTAQDLGVLDDTVGIQWFPQGFGLSEMSQFPTIIMAFNCQYAFLPIVAGLPGYQPDSMKKVGVGGMLAAYSIYASLGVCAYLAFRGHTENMILLNFRHCVQICTAAGTEIANCPKGNLEHQCADDNRFITLLNGLFLFAVLMGFPCVHFALRKAQIALTIGMDADFSWRIHSGLAVTNVVVALVIALAVGRDVSVVFRWTGAVASPMLSFVLPSFYYYKVLQKNKVPQSSEQVKCMAVLSYGILVICVGVTCNLLSP